MAKTKQFFCSHCKKNVVPLSISELILESFNLVQFHTVKTIAKTLSLKEHTVRIHLQGFYYDGFLQRSLPKNFGQRCSRLFYYYLEVTPNLDDNIQEHYIDYIKHGRKNSF